MDQADVQEHNNQFVQVAFDGETHQPLNKDRRGRGRQGKLTQASLAALKVVKRAGGQCERCTILKKQVCNYCLFSRVAFVLSMRQTKKCVSLPCYFQSTRHRWR